MSTEPVSPQPSDYSKQQLLNLITELDSRVGNLENGQAVPAELSEARSLRARLAGLLAEIEQAWNTGKGV